MNNFNVSVDSKSPLFGYLPYRAAGPTGASNAWTLSTSNANTSYITYAEAATVQLQWVGTAITLHGTTNTPSAYEIIRSWSNTVLDGNSTNGKDGVLFQEDNLEYGAYTLALSIARGPVTVSGANLVTGMGDLGTTLKSQNQSAVVGSGSGQVNSFFRTNFNSSWVPLIFEGVSAILQTDALGDSITFAVRGSVGFEIYGSTAYSYGAYNVSIDPAPTAVPATTQYNASTAFEVLGALKYLATGLDDGQEYTVVVTNAEAKPCDIGQVVLYSAVPAPTSTSSSLTYIYPSNTASPSSSATSKGHVLSTGAYIAIVIAGLCGFFFAVFVGWLLFRRCVTRRREDEYMVEQVSPTRIRRGRYYRKAARDSEGSGHIIDDDDFDFALANQIDPYLKDQLPLYMPTSPQPASSSSQPSPAEIARMASPSPQAGPSRPLPPVPAIPDQAPGSPKPPSYESTWRNPKRWTLRSIKRKSAQQQSRMVLQGEPAP
ncbi:hypothetical protein C8Q72DRAFT_1001287 [Fomitopsis betulina]|nr:hypothetical protein C8Q72DRAFT_1001287 [Fomitopsis betulina]